MAINSIYRHSMLQQSHIKHIQLQQITHSTKAIQHQQSHINTL